MRQLIDNKLIVRLSYLIFVYFLAGIYSCTESPVDPGQQKHADIPLSELVAGIYTGNGKFMPHLQSLGKTYECSIPDWQSLLKSGTAKAVVNSINDSTINIVLSGNIYSTGFSRNFKLHKNGTQIADSMGIIKFYINTNSLQLNEFSPYIRTSGSCIPINEYYSVSEGLIGSPPYPRFSYTSIGSWEFIGSK